MENLHKGGTTLTASKIVKVLWIDDEHQDRTEDAKNIAHKRSGVRIEILHPKEKKMKERLLEIKNEKKFPDIFLIDYFLDQVPINGETYDTRALSFAGKIRELVPEYPIYVITDKVGKKEGIEGVYFSEAQATKAIFDKILTFKDVQREGYNILYYDALDFKRIRESPREDVNVLFELLGAPDDIKERLEFVLPNELKNGLSAPDGSEHPQGNAIAFARWTKETFLAMPGFVYDNLHAATYFGMKIKSFNNISPKFKMARYSGVFAKTNVDMWWVSRLNEILFSYKKAQKSDKTNPWEIAPELFRIPKKDWSRCVVCKNLFPETVGRNLDDYKDMNPIHYRCSAPDIKKREPYFDEARTFKIKGSSSKK